MSIISGSLSTLSRSLSSNSGGGSPPNSDSFSSSNSSPSGRRRGKPENLCQRKGHKNELFTYVCSEESCERVLLCAKCRKSHEKLHGQHIKKLDEWFNGMFCRRVEDSENNKVSRKCGMNLGRLNEEIRRLEEEANQRKIKLTLQTEKLIKRITENLNEKLAASHALLDAMTQKHAMVLASQQVAYKRLKNLNRFTILENLRRQHETDPPIIPIDEIVRFLLASEDQLADVSEIENHHKRFSKLLRDLEAVETSINSDKKILQKQTAETSPMYDADYFLRDSIGMEKVEEGLTNIFEDSLFSHKRHSPSSRKERHIDQKQLSDKKCPVNRHPLTRINNKRLQDSGEFNGGSLDEIEEDYIEDTDYVCTVQENFNSASYVEMQGETLSVFADSAVSLYGLTLPFTKNQCLIESLEIVDPSQESIFEIGAIKKVNFFVDRLTGLTSKYAVAAVDSLTNQSNSMSGTILIVGFKSDPARIEVWDMSNNIKLCDKISAHECSITAVTVLSLVADEKIDFATSSYDGVIKTWQMKRDFKSKNFVLEQLALLKGHSDFITCMNLLKLNASGSREKSQRSEGAEYSEQLYLVSSGSDKRIILWDLCCNSNISSNSSTTSTNGSSTTTSASSSSSSSSSSASSNEENIQKDIGIAPSLSTKGNVIESPKLIGSLISSPFPPVKRQLGFLTKQIKITSLSSRSSTTLTSTSTSSPSDSNTKVISPFKIIPSHHTDKINCVEYLDEGYICTGSSDSTIKIWDFLTFTEAKVLQNKFIVSCVSRLSRGMLVCAANNVKMSEYIVNIWNWETGEIVSTIKSHTGRITRVHVARANTIVTCERNKVIRLWQPLAMQNLQLYPTESTLSDIDVSLTQSSQMSIQFNPAEQFLQNYHVELDPSLTPQYINLSAIGSNWNIPTTPYDKTPITCFSAIKTDTRTKASSVDYGLKFSDECSWGGISEKQNGKASEQYNGNTGNAQTEENKRRIPQHYAKHRSSIEDMLTSASFPSPPPQLLEGSAGTALSMISRLNQQIQINSGGGGGGGGGVFQNRIQHLTSFLREASIVEPSPLSQTSQVAPMIHLVQHPSFTSSNRKQSLEMMPLEEVANESENNSPIEETKDPSNKGRIKDDGQHPIANSARGGVAFETAARLLAMTKEISGGSAKKIEGNETNFESCFQHDVEPSIDCTYKENEPLPQGFQPQTSLSPRTFFSSHQDKQKILHHSTVPPSKSWKSLSTEADSALAQAQSLIQPYEDQDKEQASTTLAQQHSSMTPVAEIEIKSRPGVLAKSKKSSKNVFS